MLEYRVVNIFEEGWQLEEKLNQYGNEGWTLVSMKGNYTYIFSRNKKVKKDINNKMI